MLIGDPTWVDWAATPVLLATLGWIARYDMQAFRIPNAVTLPLIGAGLLLAAYRVGGLPLSNLLGVVIGYGIFWLIGEIYYRLRGRDGLGLGDAKLLAASAAFLGWQSLANIVLVASVAALIYGLLLAKRLGDRIAFGPWLALAFAMAWLHFLLLSPRQPSW